MRLGSALEVYRARRNGTRRLMFSTAGGLVDLKDSSTDALDDLLNSARLATLGTWVDRAIPEGLIFPIVQVARAEVDSASRAAHVSGERWQCESLSSAHGDTRTFGFGRLRWPRELHTSDHVRRRLSTSTAAPRRRRPIATRLRKAMWGQVMCAARLELPEAHDLMRDLERLQCGHDPTNLCAWPTSGFRLGLSVWVRAASQGCSTGL